MRNTVLLCCLLITTMVSAQVFYQGNSDKDFKKLAKNGLSFVINSNSQTTKAYLNAFNDYWKVTNYNAVNLSTDQLTDDDIIATDSSMDGDRIFAIIRYGELKKWSGAVSKYRCIGYFVLDGFNQTSDSEAAELFIGLAVKGMNDAVQTMKDNDITGTGQSLYRRLHNSITPKSIALKGKTLIILDGTKKYIELNDLKRKGINYKLMSTEEFTNLKEEELKDYCLMYFAYNSYTEISIFDLADNSLIYTRHYSSAKSKFGSTEISEIQDTWKQ
ncbi:hypothetical protein [Flavobacterium wongokense]|uniref:hypothetical protein n=1 Tax=Flavobacterium wongokense TaxID=2910674 RepID=UPI001F25A468|nr:hypothetical protein [Flavobacterium sp. WG47]MCF6131938.1 hypothetical protein [Flavobacterium sp. WG47]